MGVAHSYCYKLLVPGLQRHVLRICTPRVSVRARVRVRVRVRAGVRVRVRGVTNFPLGCDVVSLGRDVVSLGRDVHAA